MEHWGIAAEQIILEITERGFVDPETAMPVIAHYRQAGHRISIDDFGTGYANYERLKHLQADIIKIDGCFVRDILTDPLDAIMVKSIVEMARGSTLVSVLSASIAALVL